SAKKASPTLYDKSTSKRFSYRGSFISVDVRRRTGCSSVSSPQNVAFIPTSPYVAIRALTLF
ncbi:MAG TPA: hypothetical protein VLK78_01620, partial [Candidatus Angelobacter sp.]|nr:hypothetical protein [Candidatus Angelobacter sp.]